MDKSQVALVKAKNPSRMVKQVLRMIHAEELVSAEDKVVIKPNCVSPKPPPTGIVTDPRVVEAIIQFTKECGVKEIVIAEGGSVGHTDRAFEVSGIKEVATDQNVRLVNVNKEEGVSVKIPGAQALKEVEVSNTVMDSTYIINVPTLKIHHMAVATLCMKNLMGAILPPRNMMHARLDQKLVDLTTLIKPRINLISGIVGTEMDETKGKPVRMDLVIAGRDIVATDTVGSAVMGIDPREVKYIQLAEEQGLGNGTLEKIEVLGDPVETVKRSFDRRISAEKRETYVKRYGPACKTCSREELRRYWEGSNR